MKLVQELNLNTTIVILKQKNLNDLVEIQEYLNTTIVILKPQ